MEDQNRNDNSNGVDCEFQNTVENALIKESYGFENYGQTLDHVCGRSESGEPKL